MVVKVGDHPPLVCELRSQLQCTVRGPYASQASPREPTVPHVVERRTSPAEAPKKA